MTNDIKALHTQLISLVDQRCTWLGITRTGTVYKDVITYYTTIENVTQLKALIAALTELNEKSALAKLSS